MTSTKYRTTFANFPVLPNSTRYSATPMPNGIAMIAASATISIVPRIADFTPPIEHVVCPGSRCARSGRW